MGAGSKPFRFEGCWTRDKRCREVVAKAWKTLVRGSASFRLVQKVKATCSALRVWNRDIFSNVQNQIKSLS